MGMELVIKELNCGTTSTGVSSGWTNVSTAFLSALGSAVVGTEFAIIGGAATASAWATTTLATGPGAVLLAPIAALGGATVGAVAAGAVGAMYGATWGAIVGQAAAAVEKSVGHMLPDQVYITENGNKTWPTDSKYTSMKAGDAQSPNVVVSFPANGIITVGLFDWDVTPGDTPLGSMAFSADSPSGLYGFYNPNQDSIYLMTVIIRQS